ncbi:HNH endonuclease signature motif containing protein [Shewanella indica]|uniref:HNH endonuclease signature motif containing protein n=1 Tax=Shewanella indica TaxID=768528 RepID=A0ABU4QAD1_9GAMM|nr:HNH endonuclease signature motif containing protein [Shewanella indica]MDX6016394.1 HNH endonuclease signature motif containing protein [Shewanella indica]
MARRSTRKEAETLRAKAVNLLTNFQNVLVTGELREQVLALLPVTETFRDLGSSLIKDEKANSARERILVYMRQYPQTLIAGSELSIVAGISEYPRRIRELRVESGWPIISGKSLKNIIAEDGHVWGLKDSDIKTDNYFLLEDKQDRDAAYRWNTANQIRKEKTSVKDKLLKYLKENVGKQVSGEELQYLASDKSEWARRVRELRTEDGWQILTKASGAAHLPVGVYVLATDEQAEAHDRKIPDSVRVKVLERDQFSCKCCGWNLSRMHPADKRSMLELHHLIHHVLGGKNIVENLITLCNVCHDEVHANRISESELRALLS